MPLRVTVTDPNGADSEYSQYLLATAGKAHVSFRTARNDLPGMWQVRVHGLVGNVDAVTRLRLAP